MKQPTHPLADTFYRAQQQVEQIKARLGTPAGPGWIRPADFYEPAHLEPLLVEVERSYQTSSPTVAAQVLCAGYQWGLLVTSLSCYRYDRRIPDLSPQKLWFHWNETHGYVDQVVYESGRFACLPHDPACDHADAAIAPNEHSLREHLRSAFVEHFGPAFERISRIAGIRPRGLWLSLADRCAATLLWLEEQRAGDDGQCNVPADSDLAGEVRELFKSPESPLHNRITRITPVEVQPGRLHFCLRRAACCHAYRLDGADYCATCPHLPQEERIDRLRGAVALREAEAVAEA